MSDDHHKPSDHQPHVMPLSMYFAVAGGLIVMTVFTVWTAKYMPELIKHYTKMQITPTISIIIAMLIACFKASLVCAFFMHLKYDKPLNRLTFFSGLFFLSLFFIFTLADTLTRSDTPTAAITDNMPEEFKGLTERPPTPVWVPAWHGYDPVKGHNLSEHGHGDHKEDGKNKVDHKEDGKKKAEH
jgi:cytochrome c oxidase subunit 4